VCGASRCSPAPSIAANRVCRLCLLFDALTLLCLLHSLSLSLQVLRNRPSGTVYLARQPWKRSPSGSAAAAAASPFSPCFGSVARPFFPTYLREYGGLDLSVIPTTPTNLTDTSTKVLVHTYTHTLLHTSSTYHHCRGLDNARSCKPSPGPTTDRHTFL
jgi:hypothetical protein